MAVRPADAFLETAPKSRVVPTTPSIFAAIVRVGQRQSESPGKFAGFLAGIQFPLVTVVEIVVVRMCGMHIRVERMDVGQLEFESHRRPRRQAGLVFGVRLRGGRAETGPSVT